MPIHYRIARQLYSIVCRLLSTTRSVTNMFYKTAIPHFSFLKESMIISLCLSMQKIQTQYPQEKNTINIFHNQISLDYLFIIHKIE